MIDHPAERPNPERAVPEPPGPERAETARLEFITTVIGETDPTLQRQQKPGTPSPALLERPSIPMTVFAQDPTVPLLARIPVPAQRLQAGPRGYRFHVVDLDIGRRTAAAATVLHDRDHPWAFSDRWANADPATLASDVDFRAQNVFAVAAHTLALFERHLGRPIGWQSGRPQLFLVPQARPEANAFYSREHNAVFFGWVPGDDQGAEVHTALSYDIVAHEVTHAILDGLRPRYLTSGLADEIAFHEALADLVALLSVFTLPTVAQSLLLSDPDLARETKAGVRLVFRGDPAECLKRSPLVRLAEQMGAREPLSTDPERQDSAQALRASVLLTPDPGWVRDPAYDRPHRRAEILVAAFMQSLVQMWAGRLTAFDAAGGMDPERVAEEGVRAAQHLLGMLLRSLDYLPPIELEFADVIDSVLTADRRLAPGDEHHYRDTLLAAFDAFGITPPPHHIVDDDTILTDSDAAVLEQLTAVFPPDLDAIPTSRLRYEHLNLGALSNSPEEVFQFIWNNAARLAIDVRVETCVERVITSTRVGPDGLVVTEIMADYVQSMRGPVADLPDGLDRPHGVDPQDVVELMGGGVLVFDQFGRFRLHQRKPLTDLTRQQRRLTHVAGVSRGADGGVAESARGVVAALHEQRARPGRRS